MVKKILLITLGVIGVPVVFIIVAFGISQIAPEKPPPDFLITHNIFDLDKVFYISQFRSCDGHRSMPQGTSEPDSSMAHYIKMKFWRKLGNETQVKIFAPFDGYVTHGLASMNTDGFTFIPKSSRFPWWPFNQWHIDIAHVKLLPKFEALVTSVKSGEEVGFANPAEFEIYNKDQVSPIELDIRIGVIALPPDFSKNPMGEPYKKMDTMFNFMTDEVFLEFKQAVPGIESREDFIIPVSWRESHPCKLQGKGPYFDYTANDYNQYKYRGWVYTEIENTPENISKRKECMLHYPVNNCGIK